MKIGLFLGLICLLFQKGYAQKAVVMSYTGGYRGNLVDVQNIEAAKLTHLIYAFADLKNNQACLHYPKTDKINLSRLVKLRQQYPGLKVLLSVGGAGWSRDFSTMALSVYGRKAFAKSCVRLLKDFDLDGIDIDWEFPGYPGEGGNNYRSSDRQNYTLLFKELRGQFNDLQQSTGKHILLTTAVDGWATRFLTHTEMDLVQQYVDYVCLMAYNFNTKEEAGGHFLYAPKGWDTTASADGAVKAFIRAGVPSNKLVMGAGFFPAAFQMSTSDPKNRRYHSRLIFHGGLAKVYRMAGHNGFNRYHEVGDNAPYLFNPSSRIRISYEDTALLKVKCDYIKNKKIAGIMYWDYFSDPGRLLLHVIDESFRQD